MTETPPGLVRVPLPKGCVLLRTPEEYRRAILRGKRRRRRGALALRIPKNPGPLPMGRPEKTNEPLGRSEEPCQHARC